MQRGMVGGFKKQESFLDNVTKFHWFKCNFSVLMARANVVAMNRKHQQYHNAASVLSICL